jgi:hypothetical protein
MMKQKAHALYEDRHEVVNSRLGKAVTQKEEKMGRN